MKNLVNYLDEYLDENNDSISYDSKKSKKDKKDKINKKELRRMDETNNQSQITKTYKNKSKYYKRK